MVRVELLLGVMRNFYFIVVVGVCVWAGHCVRMNDSKFEY
jgi:hypothetical protein